MKLFKSVLLLFLFCKTNLNNIAQVVTPPVVTFAITAYWPAFTNSTGSAKGFFQISRDLVNWTTIYSFPYPTNGAWISITNVGQVTGLFFRAGSQL